MQRLLMKPWQDVSNSIVAFEKLLRNKDCDQIQKVDDGHRRLIKLIEELLSICVGNVTGERGNPLTGRFILFIIDIDLDPRDIFSGDCNFDIISNKIKKQINDHKKDAGCNSYSIKCSATKARIGPSTIRDLRKGIINEKMGKAVNHSIAFYKAIDSNPEYAPSLIELHRLLRLALALFGISYRLLHGSKNNSNNSETHIENIQVTTCTTNPASSDLIKSKTVEVTDDVSLTSKNISDPIRSKTVEVTDDVSLTSKNISDPYPPS
jgi:hypothetical protein